MPNRDVYKRQRKSVKLCRHIGNQFIGVMPDAVHIVPIFIIAGIDVYKRQDNVLILGNLTGFDIPFKAVDRHDPQNRKRRFCGSCRSTALHGISNPVRLPRISTLSKAASF